MNPRRSSGLADLTLLRDPRGAGVSAPGGPQRFGPGTVSRDAAFSFAYNAVVRVGTAVLSVVVARTLGPAGTGELGVALQVTALGVLAFSFNLPQGLAQHLAASSDRHEQARLLRTAAGLVLGFGALGGAVVALLAGPLATRVFADPHLTPALLACGPLLFASAGYLLAEGALQGLRQFGSLARWGFMVTVFDLALVLPAAKFGVAGVLGARALVRFGALVSSWVLWLRRHSAPPPQSALEGPARAANARGAMVASLVGFAGPTLLGAAATLAGLLSLRALLVRGSGLAAAGQFQAADSFAQGLLLIPVATTAALMPAVSRAREAGYAAFPGIFSRGLTQVTGLHVAVCLGAMALVPGLVPLVFGRDFSAARPVFILLAAAYGLAGPSTVFGAALLGRGEVWSGAAFNFSWAVVMVAVFAFGTAKLGAFGAAAAIAVAYLWMLAACAALLPARWSVPFSGLWSPLFGAPLFIGAGAWLALQPRVPALLAASGCLVLAAAAFALWTLRAPATASRGDRE